MSSKSEQLSWSYDKKFAASGFRSPVNANLNLPIITDLSRIPFTPTNVNDHTYI